MKFRIIAVCLCIIALIGSGDVLSAASVSGMITVTRDASRAIVSAVIETSNRDSSGSPVTYNLVMDENGQAIAQQFENKDVKIEGAINGKDITADTWTGIRQAAGSEPAYSEPEPEPEPAADEDVSEDADTDEGEPSDVDGDETEEKPAGDDEESEKEPADDSEEDSEEEY